MSEECENLIVREAVSVDDGMQEVYNEAKTRDEEQEILSKKTEMSGARSRPTKKGSNTCAAEWFTVFYSSCMKY